MKKALFQISHLFYAQILMSLLGLSVLIWKMGDLLKKYLFADSAYAIKKWAVLFYHPYEANLLNYMLFSVVFGIFALVIYCLPSDYFKKIGARVEGVSKRTVYYLLGVSVIIVAGYVLPFKSHKLWISASFLVFAPAGYFVPVSYCKKLLFPAVVLLFLFVSLEPILFFIGPARLMNEYPELFSETLVDGEYVRNDAFLSKISATQRDVFIKKFVTDNSFERSHQVMGRGQLNHVGHILNTANEYAMGKPLSTIFMQYGVGNTLLFKWTMDIFGGVSFQNYYKCYIYYPIYYFAFLIMLYFVFKDALYVFLGFSAVAFMHFFYNYIPLYFAPGLIPTIHFFDVFLILSMFAFFIGRARGCSLLCSLLFVSLGILMNRQFGAMLALAWIVTLAVYAFENRSATKKYLMVILPAALLAPVFLLATKFAGTTSENMLRTYFSGLYSWAPSPVLVMFTIIYFILSYGFLILIRTTRSHLKYLYLLSFVYSQGLFVYFYWAGLVNHFPIVIPYIVFQLILAIKIMENHESPLYLRKIIHNLKPMLLIIALVSVAVAASAFYSSTFGKKTVSRNFVSHRCFEWKFKNARLISTINPAIFNDAAGLINKYADSRGIYIISKFDAILPFVSGRYSMMPHFELNWFVIDDDKCAQVVKKFKEGRPRYIFVDSDMNSLGKDPMAGLDPEGTAIERVSRLGRLNELKKIFHEVSRGYRLVEKGELVSVYEKVI